MKFFLMEFSYSSFSPVFIFLVFLLTILKLGKRSRSRWSSTSPSSKLPPGPPKLPIIGNIHNLASSAPHRALQNLASKYGPLMHLQLGEISTVVVSSPEFAREIMKTHDLTFASRPEMLSTRILVYNNTDIAFAPYGVYWRQLKKICTLELLSSKRVQSFKSVRGKERDRMMEQISSKEGSLVNLTDLIYSSSFTTISQAAFGEKCKDQDQYISLVREAVVVSSGFCISDLYPSVRIFHIMSGMAAKLERLHREMDRILGSIIDEHRQRNALSTGDQRKKEDLLDVLLSYEKNAEFSLTTDNIKAVIMDIFIAGGETTASIVDWAMAEMIKNPRVIEKAQTEVRDVFNRTGKGVDEAEFNKLTYLKMVIKETLRLHPAAPLLLPRECAKNCEINGFEIPAKAKVIVNAWALGRDPKYWDEPERFYPERFASSCIDFKGSNFEFIPFGSGRRMCPGISFALASIETQLASLLYHFDWQLPLHMKCEDLDMSDCFGATVRRKKDLHLIPIRNK